jgi:hypothetical protein
MNRRRAGTLATVGRAERRRTRGVPDPVAEAKARAELSAYSPGTPKPGLPQFHRYRGSLRHSDAWPFLRALLLVVLLLLIIGVVFSVLQA